MMEGQTGACLYEASSNTGNHVRHAHGLEISEDKIIPNLHGGDKIG